MLERAFSYVKIEDVLKELPLALKVLCPPDDGQSDNPKTGQPECRLFFLPHVVIDMLRDADLQNLDGEEAADTEKQVLAAIAAVAKVKPAIYIESN